MKRLNLLAALLLMVAGVQTAWGQGFRVYQSDGTELRFSLKTDSIVFDNGLSGDEVFGPFTPVNLCIAKTWYKSKNETLTFYADGTMDAMPGFTYKFFPYQGNILIFNASGAPFYIYKVYELTAEKMILSSPDGSDLGVWSSTKPVQLVTSIVLSETSITLQPDETKRLTATVLPADANNPTVVWESSNEAVAEVNNSGRVTANAAGTCVITCSATDGSGVKAECQVKVGAAGQTYTVNGVSFTMIPVEGGTFQMGSTSGNSDEMPMHQVTVSSFSIGQTEVTQALWYAVMGTKPSWSTTYGLGDNYPAYYVSWNDCQTFITKLNQLTGKTFRLPTEAEWEYAARGGNKSNGYTYSGSNTIDEVAWYTSNSSSKTHEVATKSPNELGIYDMSGNVWEWCQDWYSSSYYSSSPSSNPTGPTSGSRRVERGGCWGSDATGCRVAFRSYLTPTSSYDFLGFRLAQ